MARGAGLDLCLPDALRRPGRRASRLSRLRIDLPDAPVPVLEVHEQTTARGVRARALLGLAPRVERLVFEADAPRVTIRRGAFGTYRLSVEGINSSVRVRRIE
jgi:hypothetical protein